VKFRRETWTIPAQVAGQNVSYRVPGGIPGAWLLAAHATLTADATVADRTVFFRVQDSQGITLYSAGAQAFQTASQVVEYTLASMNFFAQSADELFQGMAMGQLLFSGEEVMTIGAGGIQAGDVFSDLSMTVAVPVE
jgi:hypothetical protein